MKGGKSGAVGGADKGKAMTEKNGKRSHFAPGSAWISIHVTPRSRDTYPDTCLYFSLVLFILLLFGVGLYSVDRAQPEPRALIIVIIIYILYNFYISFVIHLILHECFIYVYAEIRSRAQIREK